MKTNTKMLTILVLALGLLDLSPAVAGQPSNATYVKADATGANNGSSWTDAFTDLQLALVSAVPGDEIWVTSGTYAPAGPKGDRIATFQLVSGVGIYGGFSGTETERHQRNAAAYVTVLSGDLNSDDRTVAAAANLANDPTRFDNSFHVVTATGADDTATLDGFIITDGYANESGHDNGGGMINIGQVASTEGPTLIDCGFEGNFALWNGGGIYNARSNLNLIHCTFRQNHANVGGKEPGSAGIGGGGLHSSNSDPRLFDCNFTENTTLGQGGGMLNIFGSPTLIGCRFVDNHSLGGNFRNLGGGLWLREPETPLVLNCAFFGNSARLGGGMAIIHDCNPTIVNTIFTGNIAEGSDRSGAAILLNYAGATLINCTLSGNSNEGVGEGGAGINGLAGVSLAVRNCVIWGNVSNGLSDRTAQINGNQAISHSCIQGGWDRGVGNLDLDPLFLDADGADDIVGTPDDDLRLTIFSPCIDTGDNVSLPADIADLDGDGDTAEALPVDLSGNRRVRGSRIDMGAYEGAYEYRPIATATKPSPINRAADIARDVVLAWEPGVSAQTHNVYFGTSWDDVDAGSPDTIAAVGLSQETHSLDVGRLAFGQTYYWRVDEVNSAPDFSVFKGEVWSFTVKSVSIPVVHWALDETEGMVVADSAGSLNATLNGNPIWQPTDGKIDGALEFDGVDDYVSTPFVMDAAYSPYSAFAWIKGGAPGQAIISQTDGSGFGGTWLGMDPSDGKLFTTLMFFELKSESVITDDEWHHLGLVWDGSHRYLYLDGAEVALDATAVSYAISCDGGLNIGADKDLSTGSFFSGLIDDVCIYNVALSAEEIAALAQ